MSTVLYAYILTSDTGFAPCVENDLLSLACCKVEIREYAAEKFEAGNDVWLLGFCGIQLAEKIGRPEQDGKLIYIAHITEIKERAEFYLPNQKYCTRTDAKAYIVQSDGSLVSNHGHNPHEHSQTDIMKDNRGKVLLSSDFKYWGACGAVISMDDIAIACGKTTEGIVQNGPQGAGLADHDKRIGHTQSEDFQGLEELVRVCGLDGGPHVLGEPCGDGCKPCGGGAAAGCGDGC